MIKTIRLSCILLFFLAAAVPGPAQTGAAGYIRQGIRQYQEKNFPEAISFLTRALENGSGNKTVYPLLGSAYLADKQPHKARAVATAGLKKFPGYVDLQWILGEACLQEKDYLRALTHYQAIKKGYHLDPVNLPSNVTSVQLNHRIGNLYDFLGGQAAKHDDFMQAIPYYEKARDYLPGTAHTYSNLAFAYLQTGQWDRSLETASSGLKKFPKDKKLLELQAAIFYHHKDYAGLERVYATLYRMDEENVDQALVYAELLSVNGKQEAAFALYGELLKAHPRERRIYASLIKIQESRMNYKGKIKVLESMLSNFEDRGTIYKDIAETYESLEEWELARKYYDTLQRSGTRNPRASLARARTYQKENKWEEAVAAYKRLLERWPENTTALERLGSLYRQRGLWKKALITYQTLDTLGGGNDVYARLGWVYQQLGDRENALNYYQKAMANQTEASYAYLETARMIRPADPDSALALSKKALATGLQQLATAQKELIGSVQGHSAGKWDNGEKKARLGRLDSLATRSFTFFVNNFSREAAEPELLRLTGQYRGSAKLYYLTGRFYYVHRQRHKALEFLRKCLQYNPNLREAHLLMGKLLEASGKVHQAILAYERSLTLDPEDATVYSSLIRLYRKQDKLSLLCNKWLVRYRSDPGNKTLKRHLIEALHKAGDYEQAGKISAVPKT